MELIRLENITKTYHLGEVDVPVLKGVSLTIRRGEMVALMGASGSGKTTLMNILGCLDRPSSGQYWLDGEEMSRLSPNQRALVRTAKLGFVFQSFNLLPRTSAVQNVVMPLDYSPARPASAETKRLAEMLLDRVGLHERMDHEPSQMSGGQQQRVAIARSLVNRPALVLADEPTGNLDSHTSVEILRMFQQLNAEGITVILVTHDAKVAAFADRTIRIADGLIEGDETRSSEVAANERGAWTPTAAALESRGSGNGSGNGNGRGNGNGSSLGNGSNVATAVATAIAITTTERVATVSQRPMAEPQPAIKPVSMYGDAVAASSGFGSTRLVPATWRTALNALRRNKMRSALTALGVIIGVAAVIAMTEIGEGSKAAIQKQIASMGANKLIIFPGAAASSGISWGIGSRPTLTPQDSDQLVEQCPSVEALAPVVQTGGQVVYGRNNWRTGQIVGSTPSYLQVQDWTELDDGDMFTDRDVRNAAKVCLIGKSIERELFEGESPVGKEIRVQNVGFRVIGVLSRKGANMMGRDQDDIVLAPWTTIKFRVNAVSGNAVPNAAAAANTNAINSLNNLYPATTPLYASVSATQTADSPQPIRLVTVDTIFAKAASAPQIPQAMTEIKDVLRDRHHVHTDDPEDDSHDDFNVRDMTDAMKTLTQTSTTIRILLLIVAFISLVVGGVGIMNIMLVSVTERTREIGLRMAVGARSHHILRQFLVEAVVLCLVGGGTGILLGRGASIAVRYFTHWATQPSLMMIAVSVAISALVGITFGFYPAWKASRLDPIEALRYE